MIKPQLITVKATAPSTVHSATERREVRSTAAVVTDIVKLAELMGMDRFTTVRHQKP
jgi:hypothetical protein